MNKMYPNDLIIKDKIKELKAEISAWKKMLYSRMEENVLLKNKLGDLLKNKYVQNYMEEIEEFQNRFIREDEVTDILRSDVANLDYLSYRQTFKDKRLSESFERTMKKLRDDMIRSENHFCFLIMSFDDFMYKISK